jgi:hypothetical protein
MNEVCIVIDSFIQEVRVCVTNCVCLCLCTLYECIKIIFKSCQTV